MSTSDAEMAHLLSKKPVGKWAQKDLAQKPKILKALYDNINKLSPDDKDGLVGFLAGCIGKSKTELNELFDKVAKTIPSPKGFNEFRKFFQALKPLDAKLIPFNCETIKTRFNPWPTVAAQSLQENCSVLLKEYLRDSVIPAAVSVSDTHRTIHLASSDVKGKPHVYPIHSVAKVFTGVLAIKMIHEKPDGEHRMLSEDNLDSPIREQLDPDVWKLLPETIQAHLDADNVTLRQLMTHRGGLGDYGYDSGTGTYRDKLEAGENPEISQARDFLQFAENKIYPTGQFHYSNLGITLVGLAVENAYKAYREEHPTLSLPPLNFFGILKRFVLDEAKITNFFERAPGKDKYIVQTNPDDKAALGWVGGPAGGYWTTTEDLLKFGHWLYEECRDPTFQDLIMRNGDEFYNKESDQIMHPGSTPYSTAFFSLDLKTGNIVAVASTEGSATTLGLEIALGNQVLTTATQQLKDRLAEMKLAEPEDMTPNDSSEAEKREKFNPSPLDVTPKSP